ncbi:MAG: hypothetical protein GC189_02525 [Alphaproteobacteria bacterium]|nr:hypothetical protein [Alphaproteobacteria bacterium]
MGWFDVFVAAAAIGLGAVGLFLQSRVPPVTIFGYWSNDQLQSTVREGQERRRQHELGARLILAGLLLAPAFLLIKLAL